MTEELFHIDSGISIHLPSEMHIITDGVFESLQYLNGLKSLDVFYASLDQTRRNRISDGNDELQKELKILEDKYEYSDSTNKLVSFKDLDKLKEHFKDYILLKEKIDKFQIEILNELIDVAYGTIQKLTKKKQYLEQYSAPIITSMLIRTSFLHSKKENKKISYFLIIDGTEQFDKSINPYENYFNVEVMDYSYSLERDRIRFQNIYEKMSSFIFSISEIEEKRNLEELVKKQYTLNRQMVLVTYIIGFFTIVMTLVSIIQWYNMK